MRGPAPPAPVIGIVVCSIIWSIASISIICLVIIVAAGGGGGDAQATELKNISNCSVKNIEIGGRAPVASPPSAPLDPPDAGAAAAPTPIIIMSE